MTQPIPQPVAPSSDRADLVLVKVAPEEIVQGTWYRMPLLGIGYLAAYVRTRGVRVAIVDAMFDRLSFEATVARIVARRPALVGFTAMTHEVARAAQVAREVRRRLPGVRVVVGGPHATALPRRTLEEFPEFDFAVVGEGEETLAELWQALGNPAPLGGIRGLAFRDAAGAIVVNEERPWLTDLDTLPRPAWDLYGPADVYQIYASRGCPFRCVFCMRVLGDTVRYRSPKSVVDEFEEVVTRYGPRRIDFSDETFTMRRAWVLEICDELERRGLHRRMPWFANGRVNTVDEDLLRRVRSAGCVRMGFGIESGNQAILHAAQKGTTIAQIEKAIATAHRVGLETEAFYILGFPGETRATALDTIRLAARLNTTSAAFGIMVPYPGTEVAAMAARGEGGYRLLSHDWSDYDKHLGNALELEALPRRELERLQARAYLWFYARNLRLGSLARFAWDKRKAAVRLVAKILGRGKPGEEGRKKEGFPAKAGTTNVLPPEAGQAFVVPALAGNHSSHSSLPLRTYVLSQFPEFCETFVLNEMIELGKRGVPFVVFSLKPCGDTQFQPGAREIMQRATSYSPPIWSPAALAAHARCILRHPVRWASTLALALRAVRGPREVFAKTLYVFAQAPWFASRAELLGVRHVHAHWASIPSSAGLFIARLLDAPFSMTAHAYDIFIDRTLLAEKIRAAQYLVTCTEYNRRFLCETYREVPPERIHAVYHGVDLDVFSHEHDPATEQPTILAVGRLCDTKGFPDLIEACRLLRERGVEFRCRIVGDGYMRAELEGRIADAHLGAHVTILGLLPRDAILREYRQARLLAMPCVVTPRGDRDGLPNVVLEAMAMGLPVVATRISALPEAVEDAVTGRLVPPGDPAALAAAIENLWHDAPLRAKMGEAGRQRVAERFGLYQNVEALAALTREHSAGA